MKYLRKFATEADVLMTAKPNVVLVGDTSKVIYNQYGGVYIQHIDGRLFPINKWSAEGFSNEEANGVAVLANEASFVIAKEDCSSAKFKWGGYNVTVNNIVTSKDLSVAKLDYNGASNTNKIITRLKGYVDSQSTSGAPAAQACADYVFPNRQVGYLPSLGEWELTRDYRWDIEDALSIIGGKAPSATYWTSTQYSATSAWRFALSNFNIGSGAKGYTHNVRAFAPLNI